MKSYKRLTFASEASTRFVSEIYDVLLLVSLSAALRMRALNADGHAVSPMLLSCRGHDPEACPAASALLPTLPAPSRTVACSLSTSFHRGTPSIDPSMCDMQPVLATWRQR